MKRTMKRALFPLMLALVLLLPACGSGGGNGAPADQTASSTPGAAGGETAEFGGIYEVESPSQSPQESPVYQDPTPSWSAGRSCMWRPPSSTRRLSS